jgi:pimeloyl-ACP methyl ester carboxylesterase
MAQVKIDGTEISYEVRGYGGGTPVVFVHASPFVEWFGPLLERLAGHATTLHYHRRPPRLPAGGYVPLTTEADAVTCAALLDHLGWDQAHVVGHSYGAIVALQLALDRPAQVCTLMLLEPAARGVSASPDAAAALRPVLAAYRDGDRARAVDLFLRVVCGDGYRAELDELLPDGLDIAVERADMFFQSEMPAVGGFRFGPADAARVTAPILNVRGTDSAPRFVEASDLVQTWFPDAEQLTVAETGHFLMLQRPDEVAQGYLDFLAHHPAASVR